VRDDLRPSSSDLKAALATVLIFVVFDRSAAWLGSTRGEAGVAVCAIVLALVFGAERWLGAVPLRSPPRALGLGPPQALALALAAALCGALLLFFPLFAMLTERPLAVRADAAVLALGIFAQGGIAEEALFRGFLYRRLRVARKFWPAAALAALPFIAAHLLIFATLDFAIALAAVLVSVSLTFPLARLFDLAGGSIWPGAIVHAVVQGAIKLVELASGDGVALAIAWMIVSAAAPWIVFALPLDDAARARSDLRAR
jgi:membrane protease YdiL (CAAX protease family)